MVQNGNLYFDTRGAKTFEGQNGWATSLHVQLLHKNSNLFILHPTPPLEMASQSLAHL